MGTRIPQATHEGIIHIGDAAIPCAVLEDGRRLLTQSGFMKALGRARQAKGRQYYDADVNMPAFLTAKNLKPFIPNNLAVTSTQVEFLRVKGGRAYGYPAEILPKVCDVFLDADEADALTHNQKHIVATAKILMRGLAHVGIVALVDEATGYQEVRDRLALQAILDAFLRKELAAWAKRFPDEFYQQMFRLKGWQWRGMSVNRPSVVGRYTNDLVYERLAPRLMRAHVEFPDEGIEPIDYEVCRDQFHRHKTFKSVDELRETGMKVYSMGEAGKLFDFGYAMTVHKSQGSQFPHAVVVVDWKQDYHNEKTRRLAYTAVTRAADRLTVLT